MKVPGVAARTQSPPGSQCLVLMDNFYEWQFGEVVSTQFVCVHHKSRYLFGFHLARSPTSSFLISIDGVRIFETKSVRIYQLMVFFVIFVLRL